MSTVTLSSIIDGRFLADPRLGYRFKYHECVLRILTHLSEARPVIGLIRVGLGVSAVSAPIAADPCTQLLGRVLG